MRGRSAGDPVTLVMAVKRLDAAKTRLAPAFSVDERAELVAAMLRDTVAAALSVPAVADLVVVTPDPAAAAIAAGLGASTFVDPTPPGHADPLNNALARAAATVADASNVGVLQGDLPALRPAELAAAITAASAHRRSFVSDRHGSGTSALFAFGAPLRPSFGADSARRHHVSGAAPLSGNWPGLRCDIDTAEDLGVALTLGVGTATREVAGRVGACRRG